MRGGRLREVVAKGGSTVVSRQKMSKIEVRVFSRGAETKTFGLFAMSESPRENLFLVLT